MIKPLSVLVLVSTLAACGATQPPAYQKDRAPEDRTEYNGAEGLAQQQKDQNYLMRKELRDKCDKAKIDLAIAKEEGKLDLIDDINAQIKRVCVG